ATLCVAISPDNTLALVPDRDADAVWVLDIATRKVEAQSIPTGKGPTSIAITPDGFAVTANPNGLSLSIIDIAAPGTVTAVLPAPASPYGVATASDGRTLVTVEAGEPYVGVI